MDKPIRRFLMLQGPHGPFYASLAVRLREAGCEVWRVGFNAGDGGLWRGKGYIPYTAPRDDWEPWLENLIEAKSITDIVLYGATRPIHRTALDVAAKHGVTPHILEEGYLRPYWITYERSGVNSTSPVCDLSIDQMATALEARPPVLSETPDSWGDLRAHMIWGAIYHGLLLTGSRRYPAYRPHRSPGVVRELGLHSKRLWLQPLRALIRIFATMRLLSGAHPYHIALLQLAHDANFRDNGPFASQEAFLDVVFKGFSEGAPRHHHLVLKAHPLEDGREPLRPLIKKLATRYGLKTRVHYISGGKLARLLKSAKSALTVNSTSAEQVLWRGLPIRVFGHAIYRRPELVSEQPLADFFTDPHLPNRDAYLTYRSFLLATSQVPGGFYAYNSRAKLLRQLPDLMLSESDPIVRLLADTDGNAASRQHIHAV